MAGTDRRELACCRRGLSTLPDDKPVKITVGLPAAVHRDLVAYAEVLAKTNGEATAPDPIKLIAPMLQPFMATDKGFRKARDSAFDRSSVVICCCS
ncbi:MULTISPECIES: DUF2274 domain-containing protein [Bradyrhizobium]|uniref:DUF2274 domain-containing protein n=1 Tax=Bradyrhizobium pachyrhizi TaxID=280333 RepID=UPI0009B7B708|nr:DUF2274 domain-containing protein [Bradyrhizobium pachyrhizi]